MTLKCFISKITISHLATHLIVVEYVDVSDNTQDIVSEMRHNN